jgi:alpha-glucosidase (family GH31 glycosyl hydrolase)
MITKTSKQTRKEQKSKNDTKNKKKQILKKSKSSNLNSKNISNKPKQTNKMNSKSKKEIVLKRSSGREENFDTDKLTQNVSRSGVSFPVARDVEKSITKKIKKSVQTKSTGTTKKKQKRSSTIPTKQQKLKINPKKDSEKVIVTASQIKSLVDDELKDRNQQDHSPSFSGNTTTANIGEEPSIKLTLNDREPVMDKVAANKNKVLYDPSKQKGSS